MEKFNALDYIDFSREGKKILIQSKLFVKDAKKRQKFVDDKPVKNEFEGTTLTIQFDRGQRFANSEFKLLVDEVYEPEEVIDKDVIVQITNAKVYARSANNFASLQVSLHGSVQFVNNEEQSNENNDSEIDEYKGV